MFAVAHVETPQTLQDYSLQTQGHTALQTDQHLLEIHLQDPTLHKPHELRLHQIFVGLHTR